MPRGHVAITWDFDPELIPQHAWQGELTAKVTKANLPSWMSLVPNTPLHIFSGNGDIDLTFNWDKNQLTRLYILDLHDIDFEWLDNTVPADQTKVLLKNISGKSMRKRQTTNG